MAPWRLHQLGSGFSVNHTEGIVGVDQGVMSNTVAVANNVSNTARMVFDNTSIGRSGGAALVALTAFVTIHTYRNIDGHVHTAEIHR